MSAARLIHLRPWIVWMGLMVAMGLAVAALAAYRSLYGPLHGDTKERIVRISIGSGPERIRESLQRAGIECTPWALAFLLRRSGDDRKLQAGYYTVEQGLSLAALVERMRQGEGKPASFRILEGWTFAQIRRAVAEHPDFSGETRTLTDRALLDRIGIDRASGEGLLWPDTYHFAPGANELQTYRNAAAMMRRMLEEGWARRAPGLPFASAYEALILASMVEKETGRDDERPLVAGVFVNRLIRGMRLQSDPTTIYALGEQFSGRLSRSDLQRDLPHNTYVVRGLPPSPIASPSRASIEAALRPASTRALYFVARGDGTSEFSEDLASHQRAVNRYQRGQP
jgi:UPF0755 protein